MNEEEPYVPPPRSGQGGGTVAVMVTILVLFLLGMLGLAGFWLAARTQIMETQRAVEAELRAREQLERARYEANRAERAQVKDGAAQELEE